MSATLKEGIENLERTIGVRKAWRIDVFLPGHYEIGDEEADVIEFEGDYMAAQAALKGAALDTCKIIDHEEAVVGDLKNNEIEVLGWVHRLTEVTK